MDGFETWAKEENIAKKINTAWENFRLTRLTSARLKNLADVFSTKKAVPI